MNVSINGNLRQIPDGSTIAQLLVLLEMQPRFLAVERNRELVPRPDHAECVLAEGDELEIVTLVGGG